MNFFSRSRTGKVLGGFAVVGVSALVLAGCAGSGGDTESSAAPAGDDLALKIGTALPQTGNLAFLGPPEEAGVAYAASQINEISADTGLTLDVVYGDSGDTDNKAYETEIPRLLGEDVSAIIGAASSGTSLQFIDQVVGAALPLSELTEGAPALLFAKLSLAGCGGTDGGPARLEQVLQRRLQRRQRVAVPAQRVLLG